MALVSDIQLQDGSVKPPKLDTTQKFTVAGLTATTALAVGETVPLSTTGLVTVKSANDITNWIQTTNTNGNVSLYLSNDARPDWALKVAGTASDSFIIANSYGANNTEQYPAFSIGTAGAVGVGKTGAGNIIDVAYANSTTGGIQLTETTNSVGVKLIGESTSGSIGTTTNHKMGFRVNGATQAAIDTSGQLGIGTDSPGAKLDVRGSATFNEGGAAVDFRVEGDTEANLLFVDGSADRVGIGTATPASLLHVDDGDGSNTVACFNGTINASCYAGEKEGHIIQCNFNNFTQRGGLSFNIDDVGTVTDCAGCDSTVVTINGANTCVCFFKCDGSNDDISLVGGSIGNALCNDTSPKLGGNLDVNNQCIINSNTDEGIRLVPNGAGRVIIDGLCWPASDGTAGYVLCTNGSGDLTWSPDGGSTWDVGSGVLFTNAGCKVGIGTSTPSDVLTVFSCAATTNWGLNVCDPHPACAYGAQIKVTGACTGFPALNVVQNSDTLFRVDTGGNVGIGTSAPDTSLHISGSGTIVGKAVSTNGSALWQADSISTEASILYFTTAGSQAWKFQKAATTGNLEIRNSTDSTKFTMLDNGNVGIGTTSPSAPLHVVGDVTVGSGNLSLSTGFVTVAGNPSAGTISSNGNGQIGGLTGNGLYMYGKGSTYDLALANSTTNLALAIPTGGGTTPDVYITNSLGIGTATAAGTLHAHLTSDKNIRMQVLGAHAGIGALNDDSSSYIQMNLEASDLVVGQYSCGNMGLGVVPSAWRSTETALQIDRRAALYADSHLTTALANNLLINSGGYALIEADAASQYYQYQGAHVWQTVVCCSAGANVSPSTMMTLTLAGLLGIGTAAPSHKLHVFDTSGSVVRLQGISDYNYDIESQGDGTLWDHEIGSGNAKFSWSSSSAELMRLDSTGLGIGVTSPSALIQAQAADGTAGGAIKYTATSVASAYLSASPDGAVLATDTAGIVFRTGITGNDPTDTGTERVRISSGGYLGIGTTAPNYALSIFGSSTTAQGLNICNDGGGNGGRAAFIVTGCAYGAYGVGPHETWIIPETGCALTLGDYNLNIPIKFVSNGSETARFTQGSLGIGTASPAGQLAIMGDASSTQWALNVCDLNSTCSYGARVFGKGSAAGYPLFLVEQSGSELFRVNTGANTTLNTTEVAGRFTIQEGAYGVGGEARNDVSYGTLALMGCSPATGCVLPITFNMSAVGGRSRAAIAGVDLGNSGYCMGLAFYTRGALDGTQITTADEKMRITSGGYVGIGTTAPATKLHLSDGAFTQKFTFTSTNATAAVDAGVRIQNLSDTDNNFAVGTDFYNSTGFVTGRFGAIFRDAGDRNTDLYWATRANSAALYAHMFLTSAGRLGLNTCAPETRLHIGGTSQFIKMDSGATTHLYLGGENDFFALSHNRHPSTGAIDNAACGVGVLQYENAVGWTFSANTGGSFTSRMTILNGGKVGIGTATPNGNLHTVGSIQASTHMTAGGGIYISRAPGDESEPTRITSAASGAGTCTLYIGNAAIQTSSDVRVKNNIQCYTCSAVNVLDNARVVEFEYDKEKISDGSDFGPSSRGKYVGLIAQEMIEYARWAVNDGEGDPEGEHIWKAEYQHMVPILIKAIQELNERIEELESK